MTSQGENVGRVPVVLGRAQCGRMESRLCQSSDPIPAPTVLAMRAIKKRTQSPSLAHGISVLLVCVPCQSVAPGSLNSLCVVVCCALQAYSERPVSPWIHSTTSFSPKCHRFVGRVVITCCNNRSNGGSRFPAWRAIKIVTECQPARDGRCQR